MSEGKGPKLENVMGHLDALNNPQEYVVGATSFNEQISPGIKKEAQNIVNAHRPEGVNINEGPVAFIDNILGYAGWTQTGDRIDVDKLLQAARFSLNLQLRRFSTGGAGRYDDLDSRREIFTDIDTAIHELEVVGNNKADADKVRVIKDGYLQILVALRVENLWAASSRDADAFAKIRESIDGAKKAEAEFADINLVFQALRNGQLSSEWGEIMKQFDMIMKNQTYDAQGRTVNRNKAYTHNEMMEEIALRIQNSPLREQDPGVWARKVAWAMYRTTGGLALEDPGITVRDEDKGVKKVLGDVYEAFFIEQRRKADIPARMLEILLEPVRPVKVKDRQGKVLATHGYGLDGKTLQRHVDMFGMGVLWLELSKMKVNGVEGGFWKLQPNKAAALGNLIAEHQKNNIVDSQGKPLEYPVSASDLKLINWQEIRTTGTSQSGSEPVVLLTGDRYDTWLENGDFSERSRAMAEQVIASAREGIPGMENASRLAGEDFKKFVEKTTLFYSHQPNERARSEVAFLKSVACDIYLRFAEFEEARDKKFQQNTNMILAALGGDAARNEEIYGRDLSFASLSGEPPSPLEAMNWLLMFATDKDGRPTTIDWGYTGAKAYKFRTRVGTHQVSVNTTEDVLSLAAPNGWQPERRGQTFYQWLQEYRADLQAQVEKGVLSANMTKDDQNRMLRSLARTIQDRRTSRDDRIKAANMFAFMQEFSVPVFRFSFIQQNFVDRIARKAVNYRKRPLPERYEAYLQYEAVVNALVNNTNARTEDNEGDRILKLMYSGIYGSYYDRRYTKPPERTGANVSTVLETDDWRTTDYALLNGHHEWVNILHKEFGYRPPDESSETLIPLRPREKYDDVGIRRLIFEFAKARSRTIGKEDAIGFYNLKDIEKDEEVWWCSTTEFYVDLGKQYLWGVVDKSSKEVRAQLDKFKNTTGKAFDWIPGVGGVANALRSIDALPYIQSGADLLVWSTFIYPFAERVLANTFLNTSLPIIGSGEVTGAMLPVIQNIPFLADKVLIAANGVGIASAILFRSLLLKGHVPLVNVGIPFVQDWLSVHGWLSIPQLEFNRWGRWFAVRSVNNPGRGKEIQNAFQNTPL